MGCALGSSVAAPEVQRQVRVDADATVVRRFTPTELEPLDAASPLWSHKRHREASPLGAPAFSPLKPSPSLSHRSQGSVSRSREDFRSTSPFRLSVFSASTERSLPGDSAFLWGSPQVLLQRLQQQTVPPRTRGDKLPERTPEPPEAERETPDEQRRLQRLAARACEVREVLRPKLQSENDLAQVTDQVSRAIHFIAESLPHAAETLNVQPAGLVFQALLLRAGLGRTNLAPVELERVLGEGKVDKLAWAARELCELLRVKVEDDGDLSLAMRVLEDCKRFFRALALVAQGKGISTFQLLEDLVTMAA